MLAVQLAPRNLDVHACRRHALAPRRELRLLRTLPRRRDVNMPRKFRALLVVQSLEDSDDAVGRLSLSDEKLLLLRLVRRRLDLQRLQRSARLRHFRAERLYLFLETLRPVIILCLKRRLDLLLRFVQATALLREHQRGVLHLALVLARLRRLLLLLLAQPRHFKGEVAEHSVEVARLRTRRRRRRRRRERGDRRSVDRD